MSSTNDNPPGLLAVDVGNSRVKLGWFPTTGADCVAGAQSRVLPIAAPSLPDPVATISLPTNQLDQDALERWLDDEVGSRDAPVALASVNRVGAAALRDLLAASAIKTLTSELAPIELRVEEPRRVGVDRVMAAVAANRLRRAATPAIVVDVGTAITVDLIATDGALEGGAILPGPTLCARALAESTDALPDVGFSELDESPDALGRATESAILAGVYWGAVGAIRELIERLRDRLTTPPQVFLSGGAAPSVARLIGGPDLSVRYVPHLTLAGIALSARGGPA